MDQTSPEPRTIRFGEFEADPRSGEVRRQGRKIPLQDKPFRVLALLLARPGELVTREELRQQLWPGETFVDFEHGLNTAVRKLRQALEDSAAAPHYVETLARRGYRLVAPLEAVPAGSQPGEPGAGTVVADEAAPGTDPRYVGAWRRRSRAGLLAALAVIALAAALVGRARSRPPAPGARAETASIAVLPFENLSHNAEDEYLADGLTETLITDLARVPGLLVIARNSAFQYKGRPVDVRRVGSELEVQHVLEGSLQRDGERLRINAQLVDTASGHHVWADRYDRKADDAFSMQDEIASAVRRALRARVKTVGEGPPRAAETTPEAYDAYLRGVYRAATVGEDVNLGRERDAAIPLFELAVAADPGFAPARAALAQACANRFFYRDASPQWQEKAFVEIEKALALDPRLAEAYLARADLAWTRANRFPHEAAMADIRKALALNPNLVSARWAAARIYNHLGLFDKGLAELDAARRVDPRDLGVLVRRGQILLSQRDFGAALGAFEASGTRNVPRAAALWGVGREAEALEMLAEFRRRRPGEAEGAAFHALLLARRGEKRRAREEIARAVTLDRGNSHMHHAMHHIGAAHSVLGEPDEALEWLERSAAEGFPCYPFFAGNPDLASLAGDPRFQAFLARLKEGWEHYRRTL